MNSESESPTPRIWESPLETCAETVQERVLLEDREYRIIRPAQSDRFLDHPTIQAANEEDDYMPYWPDLWPCSRMLGKVLLREKWENPLPRALEIGCGLGLPGVVALSLGMPVIFSDYDRTALQFAERNAMLNGFDHFELLPMDWRCPPEDLKVPLVLAADIIYEVRNVQPIAQLLKNVLSEDGECLLTDQNRIPGEDFQEALTEAGLEFETSMIRAGQPGGPRVKGTLYRISGGT